MSAVSKSFGITQGKGFHITFANGHTVSVQFGPGNYGENYHGRISEEGQRQAGEQGSMTAETAHIDPAGNFVEHDGDSVQGYQTPEQVLALLILAAKEEPK